MNKGGGGVCVGGRVRPKSLGVEFNCLVAGAGRVFLHPPTLQTTPVPVLCCCPCSFMFFFIFFFARLDRGGVHSVAGSTRLGRLLSGWHAVAVFLHSARQARRRRDRRRLCAAAAGSVIAAAPATDRCHRCHCCRSLPPLPIAATAATAVITHLYIFPLLSFEKDCKVFHVVKMRRPTL